MATVLVTGGAGYIGSHACKALAAAGHLPVVYDDLSGGHPEAVRWGPLERGDIADRGRLDEVLRRHRPQAVMHFAGLIEVGESLRDPGRYYANNVGGALALLAAMRDHGPGHIVFSSTCATYGIPERVPIGEDAPQVPVNPYGRSKLMVERMLADFGAAHGLRWAALRYFNACGADPDGETGERHDPETHLIPRALMAVSGEIERLEVFGGDYDTPDGTCVRDYVHVTDLAAAHVAALDRLLAGAEPFAVNLGTGRGFSVREVLAAVERVTGRRVPVAMAPRRPGDPARLVADPALAGRLLRFRPRYLALDDIVATAWRWHRRGG